MNKIKNAKLVVAYWDGIIPMVEQYKKTGKFNSFDNDADFHGKISRRGTNYDLVVKQIKKTVKFTKKKKVVKEGITND